MPHPQPPKVPPPAAPYRHTRISAREFVRDISAARRAAHAAPVLITVRGVPTEVLLSFEDYQRLRGTHEGPVRNIVELAAMQIDETAEADFDFEPPRMEFVPRVPDLDD